MQKRLTRLHLAVMMIKDYRITSYPYASSAGKVCKTEILSKVNIDD